MEKLIGVIAGTPVDTEMGVELLEKSGIKSIGYPVSKNPKEQSRLQLLSKEILYKKIVNIIEQSKNEGRNIILVYCNSLSAAVNMKKISKETSIPIITPFHAYMDYGKRYSSLLVLAANGQSTSKIEMILEESNENIKIWSLSALGLVEAIERGGLASRIYEELNLDLIIKWAELNKIEGIILGCTHFPYIKELLEEKTNIKILDPGIDMIGRLVEVY